MWKLDESLGNEVAKIRWNIVPYMMGKCLDIGCGPFKAFPRFIGVDSGKDTDLFGVQMKPDLWADVTDLSILSSGEYDCVFSSHTLEHIEDYKAALKEWWRLVKIGGYLILYLPHKDFYPNCTGREEWEKWHKENPIPNAQAATEAYAEHRRSLGHKTIGEIYAGTPFANPDHKHDFLPEDIIQVMNGWGCDLVEKEERNGEGEYSFWLVFKKLKNGFRESWKNPKPEKTCAVVRYGAIGDQIIASSIYPWLKEQGYHLTLYCQSGQGYETAKHDPHIDRFIIQERDAVPPPVLKQFWDHERKKYTKWVNLSESFEGTLLACPDRVQWEWPNHLRAKYLDRNYLEWTHELAEVPPPYRPKFYSLQEERAWAKEKARSYGKRNILWSLSGSSGHKTWPHLDAVIAAVMLEYPDVHFVLVGDEFCKILEQGWDNEKRVHCHSGKWTIRQSLSFCEVADLIIGTETGLMNAAGSSEVPKIVNLSHSSDEMLTKHWHNTITLHQPEGVGCHKHPCRQLHGSGNTDSWLDCPRHEETGTAICQYHITPEVMMNAVRSVLDGNIG